MISLIDNISEETKAITLRVLVKKYLDNKMKPNA